MWEFVQRCIGSGTGTRACDGVLGRELYAWRAESMACSRSIWCAVEEMSIPEGFLRRTKRRELNLELERTIVISSAGVGDRERKYDASVRKYVGFDCGGQEDDKMRPLRHHRAVCISRLTCPNYVAFCQLMYHEHDV